MRYIDEDEIERFAEKLLRDLQVLGQRQPDPLTIIMKLNRLLPGGFKYLRVQDDSMGDAEAQWNSETRTFSMKEGLFRKLQRLDPHARNVFAEEVGHAYLGHRGIRNHSARKLNSEKVHPELRAAEWQARRFGPAFLAPFCMIDASWTAEEIVEYFGISLTSAKYRKEETERIRARRHKLIRPLPASVITFLESSKRK